MPLISENNVLPFIFVAPLLIYNFFGSVMRAAWSWVEKWHETRADFTCLCPLGKDLMLLSLR